MGEAVAGSKSTPKHFNRFVLKKIGSSITAAPEKYVTIHTQEVTRESELYISAGVAPSMSGLDNLYETKTADIRQESIK